MTMQGLVRSSLNERGLIDKNELRKSCRNHYQFENNGRLPTLIYNKQPDYLKTPLGNDSRLAKMIYMFENTSPYDFLKAKYGGAKPTSKDVNLIESLLVNQELNPGVVNVLIDYVLRINDNKLNKNFVEAIASQWKLSNIKSVPEAMKQAEKEYRKMNQNKEKKKSIKEEKLPTWYGKDVKKKQMNEEDIKELENMLSDFV